MEVCIILWVSLSLIINSDYIETGFEFFPDSGRGIGALISGLLFDNFSARLVYRAIAGACFVLGLIYCVLHYAWLRHAPNPSKLKYANYFKNGHVK